MILMFAAALSPACSNLQRVRRAFRVPTSVGLSAAKTQLKLVLCTPLGLLAQSNCSLLTAHCSLLTAHYSLLRPLILRYVLIDIFEFVIAVLNSGVHHVALVHHLRLVKN